MYPPKVRAPMLRVLPDWVLTKEAELPAPVAPARERAPVPREAAVKVPPDPIETVPLLATVLVTLARTESVAPEPTVTDPVPKAAALAAVSVPPEIVAPRE